MKSWLAKFKRGQEEVDRALRHRPIAPASDPDLHASIMRAVRAAAASEQPQPRRTHFAAWLTASGVGVSLAAVCVGLLLRPAPAPAPVQAAKVSKDLAAAPGAALEMGGQIPGFLTAPLSNELTNLNLDLHDASRVLLASFP